MLEIQGQYTKINIVMYFYNLIIKYPKIKLENDSNYKSSPKSKILKNTFDKRKCKKKLYTANDKNSVIRI